MHSFELFNSHNVGASAQLSIVEQFNSHDMPLSKYYI